MTPSLTQTMQTDPNVPFPSWVRFLAKGFGTIGGFFGLFFGVFGILTFKENCFIASIFQLCTSFSIIAFEAPFLCLFIDFIEKIEKFSESRLHWHKAILYIGAGLIPLTLCIQLSTILGNVFIVFSGITYGFMALGRKADRNTMMGFDNPWNPQVNEP